MVLFFALCMFLLGAMLYLTIITLIFYRFTFVALTVDQMTPPYWINMGAVAITTLAGASLLIQAELWPFLVMLRPLETTSIDRPQINVVLNWFQDLKQRAPAK